MHRVVGADEQLRSGSNELRRRLEHHLAHRFPVVIIYEALVAAQGKAVQRDLRMLMRAEQCGPFQTDCSVAKRSAFAADCDDADMLHRSLPAHRRWWKENSWPC